MADEKGSLTEAQLQIERLRLLKEKKQVKENNDKKDAFSFSQHSGEQAEGVPEAAGAGRAGEEARAGRTETAAKPATRKPRVCRLDRRNFDAINSIVKKLKGANPGLRLSDDMLLNIMVSEILGLGMDFSAAKNAAELKELLHRIKI